MIEFIILISSVHLEHVGYLQIYLTNFLRQNKYLKKSPAYIALTNSFVNYDALPLKTQQLKIKKKINKIPNKQKQTKKQQQQNCRLHQKH